MPAKQYKVFFTRTAVGPAGEMLSARISQLLQNYGNHLPPIEVQNELFQIRDLELVGRVWKGTFAKLRDEAPHVISALDLERELPLEVGDRVVEKCHFLYREVSNVLVWQMNRSAGGLTRFEVYLSTLLDEMVTCAHVMNQAEIERMLAGQVYEIDFAYDRPAVADPHRPRWNQNAFDMMASVHAAHAKFQLRAPRNGSLGENAKAMAMELLGLPGAEKIRIRLTEDKEPIELFMAPLKDKIKVEIRGHYPVADMVYHELERVFNDNRDQIPNA